MSTATAEELLSAARLLPPVELERFVDALLAMRASQRAPHLSERESYLLQEINRIIAPALQQRFDTLVARRRRAELSESEYADLLELTQQIERIDADRLERIAELATLRGLPLRQLIHDLGLRPRSHDE